MHRGGYRVDSGDVDAEVAGEPGQPVGVALSDHAESPGVVAVTWTVRGDGGVELTRSLRPDLVRLPGRERRGAAGVARLAW